MKTWFIDSSAFFLSLLSVWLVRSLAYRHDWTAKPRSDRWHKRPIALYGGVGMFIPFVMAGLFILAQKNSEEFFATFSAILIGAACVFLLGLMDDIKDFKPATKLIGEVIAASLPISTGLFLSVTPWYLVNVLMTYFWFVGVINAVNMLDNMDGLSSGIVMISTLSIIAILIYYQGVIPAGGALQLAFVFLCSVAGFWIFNRPPASIFMGDSGSLFLGYVLAAIAIPSKLNNFLGTSSSMLALFLPVTIIAIPIFDTTFVTLVRKLHGRPASVGGTDHSSHCLVGLGFSEKKAVLMLYALGIIGGAIVVASRLWPASYIPLFMLYMVFLCLIGIYLSKVEVYADSASDGRKDHWTPLVSELFYKRHAGEVILDVMLISASYHIAYLLHFEGVLKEQGPNYTQSLPLIVAACMASFFASGIYRGIWHFISLNDLAKYLKGTIIGTGTGVLFIIVLRGFEGYSPTVFVIFGVLLFLFMIGSRLSFRMLDNIINKVNTLQKQDI